MSDDEGVEKTPSDVVKDVLTEIESITPKPKMRPGRGRKKGYTAEYATGWERVFGRHDERESVPEVHLPTSPQDDLKTPGEDHSKDGPGGV